MQDASRGPGAAAKYSPADDPQVGRSLRATTSHTTTATPQPRHPLIITPLQMVPINFTARSIPSHLHYLYGVSYLLVVVDVT